ncbi:MAG: hypothetical protein ACYTGC_19945 [Planctomycetota bacterium]|jgi:hypothetical protein
MRVANRQIQPRSPKARTGAASVARGALIVLAFASALLAAAASSAVEPTLPPVDVLIVDPDSADAVAELTISWLPGDGDGTVVLMKRGAPVDADPADGIQHVDSAVFGSGEEIGTGNFVVFLGAGTQVTVTNLESDVPYFVKLYSKNGTGGAIDYLQS